MAQQYTPHTKFKIVREIDTAKSKKQKCAEWKISYQTYRIWKMKLDANAWNWHCLEYESRRPKTSPKQTQGVVVERIRKLRSKRFGRDYIVAQLRREGFTIGKSGVEGVLRREGLWRMKRIKKRKRYRGKHVTTITRPGERLQMDVKHMGMFDGTKWYQYTIVDLYTRMTYRYAYDSYTGDYTVDFVTRAMTYFPFEIRTIQTDNGVEFTYDKMTLYEKEHPLDMFLATKNIRHTLTPVATPRFNGVVENVHGRDEHDVYAPILYDIGIDAMRALLRERNRFWNYERLHSALGYDTPIERLKAYRRKIPA